MSIDSFDMGCDSFDVGCAIALHEPNDRNPINAIVPTIMILVFIDDSPFNLPQLLEENG
jgi:hypothetical protein